MDASKIAINHIKDETSHVQSELCIADLNLEGWFGNCREFKIYARRVHARDTVRNFKNKRINARNISLFFDTHTIETINHIFHILSISNCSSYDVREIELTIYYCFYTTYLIEQRKNYHPAV